MHPQDARDNKLTAEIGERHPSLVAHAALAHMLTRDSSLSRTQRPDKAGTCMLQARCPDGAGRQTVCTLRLP